MTTTEIANRLKKIVNRNNHRKVNNIPPEDIKTINKVVRALTIHGVTKSFTAGEIVNELKDCETVDDAIRYFDDMRN